MEFIFAAELGRAVVANHLACFAGTFAFHDVGLGFFEFDRLGNICQIINL